MMKKTLLTIALLVSITVCAQSDGTTIIRPKTIGARMAQNSPNSTNDLNQTQKIDNIKVYDITGKLVQEIKSDFNFEPVIDLERLPKGVYIVINTLSNNEVKKYKFIKN